jgi:hypothetical protein
VSDRRSFLRLALRRHTLIRSLKVAAVIGTVLGAINHYDMFLSGQFEPRRVAQLLITYVVPYCVATYGAVMEAMRAN